MAPLPGKVTGISSVLVPAPAEKLPALTTCFPAPGLRDCAALPYRGLPAATDELSMEFLSRLWGGGADLLKSLPVTNSQQIDTWQWTISQPASMEAGNMMYATYADCSLEEGYDLRQVYDLYKDFAIYAQSLGDTVGRKIIVPDSGVQLAEGVDFVRLMYSSSISERGSNADLFYSKIMGSEASQNLKGFSCSF